MILALLAAASVMSCTNERARYALRTSPEVTAEFRPIESGDDWPARLAMRIHFAKSGRTYWFLPWSGGSDGLQHLASTTDVEAAGWRAPSADGGPRPLGDLDYIGVDGAYRVIENM